MTTDLYIPEWNVQRDLMISDNSQSQLDHGMGQFLSGLFSLYSYNIYLTRV